MSIDSQQIIHFFLSQINTFRNEPKSILHQLTNRKNSFKGLVYGRTDIPTISHTTIEGIEAVDQAINYLQLYSHPSRNLSLSLQLCEVAFLAGQAMAKNHRLEASQTNIYELIILEQFKKMGFKAYPIEVIVQYGFRLDKEILPSIVIDDGNRTRSRRNSLLNQQNTLIGIGVHEHSQYDYMLLILLTGKIDYLQHEPTCKCEIM